jgi:O-antigen/teichoic acid export membrane protein
MPLYRNAYAWLLSTGVSSALGIIYWIVAARYYPTENVGLSGSAISAMMFLSGVAQLNLMTALVRYIPNAGKLTGRLIGLSYMVTVLIAGGLGLIMLAGYSTWFSGLTFLNLSSQFTLWFIGSTMLWCVFSLQDSALTGLRDAVWVPLENVVYSIAKIVLLVLFAKPLPQLGIFASWMLPSIVLILPINFLIFRRLIPKHVQATEAQARPMIPRQIARFVAGNFAGSLFLLASTRLLPVIVTEQAGAQAGAFFFLAWTFANSLKLIPSTMTLSLTVEGARDPAKLKDRGLRFLINTAWVFVPLIVAIVLGAPYILALSGNSYSTEGSTLLRLLALSVIPGMVTLVYISIARVQQRVAALIIVQGVFCVLSLALSFWLLRLYGITGIGIAFLASETILAVILLLSMSQAIKRLLLGGFRSFFSKERVL